MAANIKAFISRLPDTARLHFHTSDLDPENLDPESLEEILAATDSPEPQFLCFCIGNGISNDWIASSTNVYRVPSAGPYDEAQLLIDLSQHEYLIADRPRILTPAMVREIYEHNQLGPCFRLPDGVIVCQYDMQLMIAEPGGSLEDVDIGEGDPILYTWVPCKSEIIKRPYIFKYGPYRLQIGPGQSLTFTTPEDVFVTG